jgi:hypothetical protein
MSAAEKRNRRKAMINQLKKADFKTLIKVIGLTREPVMSYDINYN